MAAERSEQEVQKLTYITSFYLPYGGEKEIHLSHYIILEIFDRKVSRKMTNNKKTKQNKTVLIIGSNALLAVYWKTVFYI